MSFLTQPAVQSYVDPATGNVGNIGANAPGNAIIFGQSLPAWSLYFASTGGFISRTTGVALGIAAGFPPLEETSVYGNGLIWVNKDDSSNAVGLAAVTPGDSWSLAATWGTGGSGLSLPNNITLEAASAFLTMGDTHWIVTGSQISTLVFVLRADGAGFPTGNFGFWGHDFVAGTQATANVCAGPQSSTSAKAYWMNADGTLGSTTIVSGAETYSPATWPTTNSDISSAQIKTYIPTDFDAAWTHVALSGPAYDNTDGNLILLASTGDAVTNQQYVVKVDSTTGAVLWKVAVLSPGGFYNGPITRARIKVGTFLYWAQTSSFGGTCYSINTANGVSTTQAFTGISGIGKQMSDDVLGCILGEVSWDRGHGAITLLNATAVSGGPTMGAVYFTPGAGGGGSGGGGNIYDATKRAWAFTLDGHTFYVLQLATQGTWVYDASTNEWSKWDTATYGTLWNMINGCMWGYRVVAGSSASVNVWELAPSLLQDEGLFDIAHAVTGIIDVRTRKSYSVDGVSVAASAGVLDDITGAVFSLRFSDDQGQTWSSYYQLLLNEDDFSQEIAWRSLGSFARPGRVFEISDVGGVIRIDGADVFIDNFDEDEMQQGPQQ